MRGREILEQAVKLKPEEAEKRLSAYRSGRLGGIPAEKFFED